MNQPLILVEVEWADGSLSEYLVVGTEQSWKLVGSLSGSGLFILSAWRDGEPWFGVCADMAAGVS